MKSKDGVENVGFPSRQLGRASLVAFPHRRVGCGDAVTHGDDEAPADEDVRLAEGDAPLDHLGGAGDEEKRLAIALHLGLLVRLARILNRERMKVELRLDLAKQGRIWGKQADPDEVAIAARPRP